jgi:hypothetical protein
MPEKPKPSVAEQEAHSASFETERDEAYRAIGRYFVEFSALVMMMRQAMLFRIARGAENWAEKYELTQTALGEQTAQPAADAFFAACRKLGNLDQDELEIEKALRLKVDAEIRRRNLIAHGDWFVMKPLPGEPRDRIAALHRIKASSVKNPHGQRQLSVQELTDFGDTVRSLTDLVVMFIVGSIGFSVEVPDEPILGVKHWLALRNGQVVPVGS